MGTTKESFRRVIGHFATGVTVITTRDGQDDHGATASAVSSLSLEPPMLLVCLNLKSGTQEVIQNSGVFGVNILNEDQGAVAERFAMPGAGKFVDTVIEHGELGVPLLSDALAHCECRVVEDVTAGTHRVFLAEVLNAVAHDGTPLTYFRGQFGRFETTEDRTVYEELRRRVLNRVFEASSPLDLAALAQQFSALPSAIYHAVTKLVTEGLLGRNADHGYFVRPITVETSDLAFDSRCVIELGVAGLTVGRAPADEIVRLRGLMEQTEPLVADGRFVDVEVYSKLNAEFHSGIVSLAKNDTLLEAYDRLCIPGLMVSSLKPNTEVSQDVVADHRRLVEAYEAGNLPRALQVIVDHNEHSKQTCRRAIESAGGQL